jgi:hypothetical protein
MPKILTRSAGRRDENVPCTLLVTALFFYGRARPIGPLAPNLGSLAFSLKQAEASRDWRKDQQLTPCSRRSRCMREALGFAQQASGRTTRNSHRRTGIRRGYGRSLYDLLLVNLGACALMTVRYTPGTRIAD